MKNTIKEPDMKKKKLANYTKRELDILINHLIVENQTQSKRYEHAIRTLKGKA